MGTAGQAFLCLLLCTGAAASQMRYELYPYESVADPKAVVHAGNARFTVLTDSLLRMEYSAKASFEDRPTLAFVNRKLPVPQFNATASGGGVTITTSTVRLVYKGGEFTGDSLTVSSLSGAFESWSYGMTSATDKGNLRGTFRTLDGLTNRTLACGPLSPPHCEWGLVSRSGWALVDDTDVPCLDADDWWADASGKMLKNADDVDIYLFAHGKNFRQALKDYTAVGGKIPIIPRANSGIWYTRWYDLANIDVRKTVEDYASRDIPLDVMILDMNWHKKDDWSGYSWDRNLFPYPADTMDYLHSKGIKVGANLHDATGIGKWEDKYDEVCKFLGLDPQHPGGEKGVPFSLVNKSYVTALEDIVLKAVEDDGMDFWWIDWQQGESGGGTGQDPRKKMNPTIWTDKMRVTDSIRRCKQGKGCTNMRGVVNARWGGLGNHRYQHGFSGDVAGLKWANLAYQAYFSATASNVGWGFWSHDIEGPGDDHEMYARWLQLGSFSGIMRSHDRGMSAGNCMGWPTSPTDCPTVQPYNVPRLFFEINRQALRDRAALLPYIYTQSRVAFEEGLGITRPMYYYWPTEQNAYPRDMDTSLGQEYSTRQYYFGDKMLVAPVTTPSDCPDGKGEPCGLVNMTVWLPPGTWVERDSGAVYSGPRFLQKSVAAWEIPIYIVGGSVIPTTPLPAGDILGRASRAAYDALEFTIYPGGDSGSGRVYEDDGNTYDYLKGMYAWTTANYTRTSSGIAVQIATSGTYSTLPKTRLYTVKVVNSYPPSKVTFGGQELKFSRWGGAGTWSYDGPQCTVVIELPVTSVSGLSKLDITVAPSGNDFNGIKGMLSRAVWAKRNLDETRTTPGAHKPDPKGAPLSKAASLGDALSYLAGKDAATFKSSISSFPAMYKSAVDEIRSLTVSAPLRDTHIEDLFHLELETPLPHTSLSHLQCESSEGDVETSHRTKAYPLGISKVSQTACCALCAMDTECTAWIYDSADTTCWPLASYSGSKAVTNRVKGFKTGIMKATVSLSTSSSSSPTSRVQYSASLLSTGLP